MKILKMVGFEVRNIMKSRFLLVLAILAVLAGVAVPVGTKLMQGVQTNGGGIRPIPLYYATKAEAIYAGGGYGGSGQDPITVDGVTIPVTNPFYWNVQNLMQQKDSMDANKGQYTTPEAMDLASSFLDLQIGYFAKLAPYVTDSADYRANLVFQSTNDLTDKFIYEHSDASPDALLQAIQNQKGMDPDSFKKMYVDITPADRQAALAKTDDMLTETYDVVQNNDFPKFIDLSIRQQNDQIKSYQDNIKIQEQAIVDNPAQADNIQPMIDSYKQQIDLIQNSTIPLLQYRLQKNIIPGKPIWQNTALDDISNNRAQLEYTTVMSQDDFLKNGMLQQYGSYQKYVDTIQNQKDELNNNIVVAQKSLDVDKPDMKYVPAGSRSETVIFLNYSAIIALFAVLVGGWIIASEFQQGTIRLLMIRPKKRLKILLSKFAGAFVVCLALFVAASLLNIIVNGICFGFADYGNPNYSISGPMGFFAYYAPKFLACIVPILFGFSVAFMLSTIVKNVAVSIAVPVVCYVGSFIAMTLSVGRPSLAWLSWTPAPYAWLPLLFTPNSPHAVAVAVRLHNQSPLRHRAAVGAYGGLHVRVGHRIQEEGYHKLERNLPWTTTAS